MDEIIVKTVDKESLLEFIAKAHKNTYAAPKEIKLQYKCQTPILEGHKDYDFVDGDWRYHDSYAGSQWAPGREVVFYQNKPVWCMSYQGQTAQNLSEYLVEKTFEFLKNALRNMDENMPFRGPVLFAQNGFEYVFRFKGDYQYFTGRESIKHKGKELFFQDVMGGLVK
jgi:hypothetical protein